MSARWCAPNGARAGFEAAQERDREDRRTFALVVDDSITVRRVTQRLLERNGMRVMTAKDGVDAVSIMQEHIPDVILLDIEMPRMDGYEVASQVRNDPRLKDVPIVMITSRVGEKHRARAIELGVNDYLGKPYQEASSSMPSSRWSSGGANRREGQRPESAMENIPVSELYSLLIPLLGERLIVPRACVAEVISYQAPEEMAGAPAWYLGTISWNGRNVPVVSFEGACGQALPAAERPHAHRGVLLPGAEAAVGLLRRATQGFPQLVRVNADVVKADSSRTFNERMPVLCQVRMINETPLIPDLERLEEMISEETSVAACSPSPGLAPRSPASSCSAASAAIAAVSVRSIRGPRRNA